MPRSSPVAAPAAVVAYAPRERARRTIRAAFPRRHGRVVIARAGSDFSRAVRAELVDAALVELAGDDASEVSSLARELPSIPFFAYSPLRTADAPLLARAAALDHVDVLVEGVDDGVLASLIAPHRFTARLRVALATPPEELQLTTSLQQEVWRSVVSRAGRPTTTTDIAEQLGVTREHLSRSFASRGAPTLKRLIDLVRLFVAAELAKNPGYDLADVARILGFASSSHLASTTQRLVGTRPTSLARLRTVDLLERFARG